MPTSLFPEEEQFISIRQGRTGDCYLLATLDCLLNGLRENRDHVKSLFRQNEDGSIELKLRSSELTQYLNREALSKKGYSYKLEGAYDIFTISPDAVMRIDDDRNGVETNCLAIKLLEHILPYYYANRVLGNHALNSVFAHNEPGRHSADTSSTEFMGKLLGVKVTDKPQTDIDDMIRQKLTEPDKPLYISMNYGLPDVFGIYHGRHALKVKSIIPHATIAGEYRFILSNPHNNNLEETYLLSDIRNRNPRFSLMELYPSLSPLARLAAVVPLRVEAVTIIIAKAINEKMKLGMPNEEASRYVATSMFKFMISRDYNTLTASGGLREYFQKNPAADPLQFLKQMDLSSKKLNEQLLELIVDEYSEKRNLTKQAAHQALNEMLKNYKESRDQNSITRTANLRQLISEGILDVDNLLNAFPAQEAKLDNNQIAAKNVKNENIFFDVVQDNYLTLLKDNFSRLEQQLSLSASRDIAHRIKESSYLSRLMDAKTFTEIKQIAQEAKAKLSSGSTHPKFTEILDAIESSHTSDEVLVSVGREPVKEPPFIKFSEQIRAIEYRLCLDAFWDVGAAEIQDNYLKALLKATSFEQIQSLTALSHNGLKDSSAHYMVCELREKISASTSIDDLLQKFEQGATLRR